MRNRNIVTICVIALAATAAVVPAADDGFRTVQVVYHSDTRGYYLPCG